MLAGILHYFSFASVFLPMSQGPDPIVVEVHLIKLWLVVGVDGGCALWRFL